MGTVTRSPSLVLALALLFLGALMSGCGPDTAVAGSGVDLLDDGSGHEIGFQPPDADASETEALSDAGDANEPDLADSDLGADDAESLEDVEILESSEEGDPGGDSELPPLAESEEIVELPCEPYVEGSCPEGQGCFPLASGGGLCRVVGAIEIGEACGDGLGTCATDLVCLLAEGGQGTCSRYCDPVAQLGDPGACADTETCLNLGIPAFGVCVEACDPWAAAEACPPGSGCVPSGIGGGACVITGTTLTGEACSPPGAYAACASGSLCVADSLDAEEGLCRELCRPRFALEPGAEGDCLGDGAFCALKNSHYGVCRDDALGLEHGEPCEPGGAWCAEDVVCTAVGEGPNRCVAFCRPDVAGDCPVGATCYPSLGSDPGIGICF